MQEHVKAFYVMTSLCAPTYKQQQTALDSGEFWEGADVDSIEIRRLRTDATSQIRCLRTDATFTDLSLRLNHRYLWLNSLLQFRFVASELTLLQRFVALHAVRRHIYHPSTRKVVLTQTTPIQPRPQADFSLIIITAGTKKNFARRYIN